MDDKKEIPGGVVSTERVMRGTGSAGRLNLVLAELDEALDQMAADTYMSVLSESTKGPLAPNFAVAKWYEYLSVNRLRRTLTKQLKTRIAAN